MATVLWFATFVFAIGQVTPAAAQGVIALRAESSGPPLISDVFSFTAPSTSALLQFRFGFSTDEQFRPNQFFDSFTISLQDAANQAIAVFVTADAGGVLWAPPTPGALSIDPGSITRTPTAFPSLQPVLANQVAFSATVPIPSQFAGRPLNLHFDLFNNQNSVVSLGWHDVVAVPEPGMAILAMSGIALLWGLSGRHPRRERRIDT